MKNKKTIYNNILIVLGIVLVAILVFAFIDSKPKYEKICDFNFNSKDSGVEEMKYDNWNKTNGAEFFHSKNGGMDNTGCLVITTQNEDDARYIYTYDDACENTYYRMSVWLKTENVGKGAGAVGANVSVLGTYDKSKDYTGTNDWKYIEYYGQTGEGQTSFTVCLRLGFYGGTNTGTVFFDDFKLEQLEELPKGVRCVSMGDGGAGVKDVEQHADTMLTASIMLLSLITIFIIVYRYALKSERENPNEAFEYRNKTFLKLNLPNSLIILLLFGLLLRIVFAGTMPQCDIDVNLFQYWGNKLSEFGITDFYSHAKEVNCDYPPLFMYYLYFIGSIASKFGLTESVTYDILLKLPSIIADIAIAYLIYKIAHKKLHKSWTLFFVSIWLFNPMVILDSACWGQVDSILALMIFVAVYFITKEDYIASSICIALAIALKPQGMFIVPILGFALLRRLICRRELPLLKKRILPMVYSIIAFIVSFIVVILPFGFKMKPNIFKWIFDMYLGTANGYEYATVNSFDFFYLFDGNWIKDDTEFVFGLSYFQIGMLAVVIICLVIGVVYVLSGMRKNNITTNKKTKSWNLIDEEQEKDREFAQIYLFSAAMLYAVTMFAPRMHERYFYPALILLLGAVVYSRSKILLGTFCVMSVSTFYSVLEIMTGISIGRELLNTDYATAAYYYWPPINWYRGLLAAINVLIAVVLMTMAFLSVFVKIKENKKLLICERKKEKGDGNAK